MKKYLFVLMSLLSCVPIIKAAHTKQIIEVKKSNKILISRCKTFNNIVILNRINTQFKNDYKIISNVMFEYNKSKNIKYAKYAAVILKKFYGDINLDSDKLKSNLWETKSFQFFFKSHYTVCNPKHFLNDWNRMLRLINNAIKAEERQCSK